MCICIASNGKAGRLWGMRHGKSRLARTHVHDLYIELASKTFGPQLKLGDALQVIGRRGA